ncbi:hypothetical protein MBT84_43495 [Streptomyces sp. MBT84]|nr:hypothetical protein [Streptomyces sp. MBT84]
MSTMSGETHSGRRLSALAVSLELPHCRNTAGRARHHA